MKEQRWRRQESVQFSHHGRAIMWQRDHVTVGQALSWTARLRPDAECRQGNMKGAIMVTSDRIWERQWFRKRQSLAWRMIGQWQEQELKWINNREKEEYYRRLKSEWPWEEKKIRTGRTKTLRSKETEAHRDLVRSQKLEMTTYLHSTSKTQGVLCVFHVWQKNLHCLTVSFRVEKKYTTAC